MIKELSANRWVITPRGLKQHVMAVVFTFTGDIKPMGSKLLTSNRRMKRWFR